MIFVCLAKKKKDLATKIKPLQHFSPNLMQKSTSHGRQNQWSSNHNCPGVDECIVDRPRCEQTELTPEF